MFENNRGGAETRRKHTAPMNLHHNYPHSLIILIHLAALSGLDSGQTTKAQRSDSSGPHSVRSHRTRSSRSGRNTRLRAPASDLSSALNAQRAPPSPIPDPRTELEFPFPSSSPGSS